MPEGWRQVALGAVVSAQYGLSEATSPNGVPIIGMQQIADGTIVGKPTQRVQVTGKEFERFALHPGDVLLNRTNSLDQVGKSALVPEAIEQCVFASYLVRLGVDRNQLSPSYLVHVLNSRAALTRLRSMATPGVSQYNINPSSLLRHFPLLLPPLPEQTAIAEAMDSWRAAAVVLKRLVDAKRRFRLGLMQELLTGKRRLKEFTAAWQRMELGELLKETWRPAPWDDDRVYRLASVRRNAGGLFYREALPGGSIKVKKLYELHTHDLLISHIQAAYGAFGFVPADYDGAVVSDLYSVLIPREAGSIDVRFFAYLFQLKRLWHLANLASNGFFAERLRLNFSPVEFLRNKILLPVAAEEQAAIADLLETLDRELGLLTRLRDALDQQRKGVAELLLTGKVRVPEALT